MFSFQQFTCKLKLAVWAFGMLEVSFLTASNQRFRTSFAGCEHKVAVSM